MLFVSRVSCILFNFFLEMYLYGRDGNKMSYIDPDTIFTLEKQSSNFSFPSAEL